MKRTCGTVVEWSWQSKPKCVEKNLFQCHFTHHKSHMELPCDWNRSFTARGRQLTTWVMTLLDELSLAVRQIKQSHTDTSWVSRQLWGSFEFHPTPEKLVEYICRPYLCAMHNFVPYTNSIWRLSYRNNLGPLGVLVTYWRRVRFKSRTGFPLSFLSPSC